MHRDALMNSQLARVGAKGVFLALSFAAYLSLSACTSSSPSSASSSREQARGYARGSIPCATASDCCVVIDRCINQALVVRSADRATVAALVSQPDPAGCTGCLLPAVQVSCVSQQCTGALVDPLSLDAGADAGVDASVYASLTTDHCGSVAGVPPAVSSQDAPLSGLRPQSILGCGPH